jgi:transcriptional regulator with XRE-family HTH domain
MKLRIKELAKKNNLTISSLALRSGVTQATLSNTINGKSKPSFEVLEKIAAELGVELWELFTESTKKEELTALISFEGKLFRANSFKELDDVITKLKAY